MNNAGLAKFRKGFVVHPGMLRRAAPREGPTPGRRRVGLPRAPVTAAGLRNRENEFLVTVELPSLE